MKIEDKVKHKVSSIPACGAAVDMTSCLETDQRDSFPAPGLQLFCTFYNTSRCDPANCVDY